MSNSPTAVLRPTPAEVYWRRTALVLDEHPEARAAIRAATQRVGWGTEWAEDFGRAEQQIFDGDFDGVVSNTEVKGHPIVRFLRFLSEQRFAGPVLMLGADRRRNFVTAEIAYRLGLNVCGPLALPLAATVLERRLARIDARLSGGMAGCCHRDCHFVCRPTRRATAVTARPPFATGGRGLRLLTVNDRAG